MDELNNNIQAIIREKYTAIHPSAEWRFRKAALNSIEAQRSGIHSEMESIVFEGVYPLYGVSDIRSSSTQRSAAIRADLAEHLTSAREIIQLAASYKSLPFLDELAHRIGTHIVGVEFGLGAGDEVTITDFLRREVEPFFDHMQEFGPDVREKIQVYQADLDPGFETLYRAMVKGRAERLTQPGKIAIVYLWAKESLEYREYIDYLQALECLTDAVEEVGLEELHGIQGLKALRVEVDMRDVVQQPSLAPEQVEEAVRSMSQVAS